MSPSTQTKDCPRCHTALATDAPHCGCGHQFADAACHIDSDLETQAEVLYETHLRARLQRATRLTRAAKVDLLRDPTSTAKKAQLREMEKELLRLEQQLDTQSVRIADARLAARRSMEVTAMETFRATQNAKAQQSMGLNRLQAALDGSRATQASGAFSTAQAGRAADVVDQKAAARTCPSCNAAVTTDATHCACGYELRTNGEHEFIGSEERSALRGRT